MNTVLVLCSAIAAYFFPFELLLASFAFLGPAHYLTEISWLETKNYYFNNQKAIYALAFLGLISLWIPELERLYFCSGIALATSNLFSANKIPQILSFLISASLLYFFTSPKFLMITFLIGVFLPTVIHIYFFTGLFMFQGYLKSKNKDVLIALGIMGLSGIFFLISKNDVSSFLPNWTSHNLFKFTDLAQTYLWAAGLNQSQNYINSILRFLAFAYTFHYLNWFSKTGLTGWHKVSKNRSIAMVLLYVSCIGLYIYDYQKGFKALYYLSLLHVQLELPLNFLTIRNLIFYKKHIPKQKSKRSLNKAA